MRNNLLSRITGPKILGLILSTVLLLAPPPTAKATMVVYDPTNFAENLLQYIEHIDQTAIQNTISATETTISQITNTISQYTQYIYNLENLVQQATGTVTGRVAFIQNLFSQIESIPTSFQNAFQSILDLPNQLSGAFKNGNWGAYANSTNPIQRYLGNAMASLQNLLSALSHPGGAYNGFVYSPSRYAANLSQALGAQTLANAQNTTTTLSTLQNNAKSATTLQAGQSVSNAVAIQDLAARNQQVQLQAASNLYQTQNQNVLNQYQNTITAGKQQTGMANQYNQFNP